MPRVALGVQYDGRGWSGWQSQPDQHTVQDTLEAALSRFADQPIRIHAAGRTDTGVHATAQIVHFDTSAVRLQRGWVRGVNRYLPPSVAVRWATAVPEHFHARFSALSRAYTYVLYVHPVRAPHLAGRAGWDFHAIDVAAMQRAAQALLGEHDFSAFRSAQCQARSPVRRVTQLQIDQHGAFVVFQISANGFLHHMVRNVIGALLAIGRGHEDALWLSALLAGRDRTRCAPTFMADGLYLTGVAYPEAFVLPPSDGLEVAFPGLADL